METRKKINKLKQEILDSIKQYAEKGNIADMQRFTDLIPRIQILSNSLDEIDIKVNLLERSIHEALMPQKNGNAKNKTVVQEYISNDLTARDKAKIKRNEFIEILKNKGIYLEQFKGVVYRFKKTLGLVGIAYSGEKSGSWFLGLPELDLQIIVLLCLKEKEDVYTIILPKDFCNTYLNQLSTSNGQVKFSLRRKGEELILYTKKGNISVSKYINNYSAFL